MKHRVVDLFSGTGAFSLVFEELGKFEIVFANDFEKNSEKIYNLNFNHKLTCKDLTALDVKDIPEHDILSGGFPCQPFSVAGKQEGFNDSRSNVFWKILEILKYHKPKVVLLENVKNLESHDEGHTFNIIKQSLTDAGYHIKHKVLNTSYLTGIPQNRERIYIVGFLSTDAYNEFCFPSEVKVPLPIKSVLDEEVADKYYYDNSKKVYDEIIAGVTKNVHTNTVYQYRRYYVRENKNGVCPTLTANMGGGGHNVPIIKDDKGIRKLTPRECFNLQGFPLTYNLSGLSDSALYKLAGNAVSVPVIRKLISEIIRVI